MLNFGDDRITSEALRVIGNLTFGDQEVTKVYYSILDDF